MAVHPQAISICTGIGGLDLAARMVFGARSVCYVEREAAALEILAARIQDGSMDDAPVWSDARSFDGKPWRGKVDLITAGYPCQPFSVAGRGLAEADPRHIWPDIKRVIGEVQPTVVVLENVQGHLKRGFDTVLNDLDELGFDAEWGIYSASQAGAPHRRNRLFVLAHRRDIGFPIGWTTLHDDGSDAPGHDLDRCVPAMADAASDDGRCGERRTQEGVGAHGERRRRPAERSSSMADAECFGGERWRERRELSRTPEEVGAQVPQQHAADREGEAVGDADRCESSMADAQRVDRRATKQRWVEEERTTVGWGGGELGHADSTGLQGRIGPVTERPHQWTAWPPGPEGDWSDIPEYLWPAVEPPVRRGPHGVPGRVDRLRALGNAVCPAQAVVALDDLLSRMTHA